MKARKCDRCKNYYDVDSKRSEVKVVVWLERPIDIDLCPDCTAQLLCWIKNGADVVEVKHGEWKENPFDFDRHSLYCSNCLQYQNYYVGKTNFCPNCGADMQGRIE